MVACWGFGGEVGSFDCQVREEVRRWDESVVWAGGGEAGFV